MDCRIPTSNPKSMWKCCKWEQLGSNLGAALLQRDRIHQAGIELSANTVLWGLAGSEYNQGSLISPRNETRYFEVSRRNSKFLRLVCQCLLQMKDKRGNTRGNKNSTGEARCCRPAGEWYPASGTPVGSGLGTRSIPGCFSLNITGATFQFGNSPLKSLCTSSVF